MAILDRMLEAIAEPRTELAGHAPRISTVQINPEYIGMVIGKGGETIRSLEADYEVQIDIEEDGTILVYATEGEKGDAAIAAITALTKDPEVGDEFTGKVVKTTDFGAFVELKKGTDGLLHVSNVGPGRVNHIEDVLARGDVARRGRAGGRQGPRPDRAQAGPEARERQARLAGGARRAGEGRPAARAARGAPAPRRPRRGGGGRGGPRRDREGASSAASAEPDDVEGRLRPPFDVQAGAQQRGVSGEHVVLFRHGGEPSRTGARCRAVLGRRWPLGRVVSDSGRFGPCARMVPSLAPTRPGEEHERCRVSMRHDP